MVSIDKKLADLGLVCLGKSVSFSCDGTFAPQDVASRMFEQAQMAFSKKRKVIIYVEDNKKHNGYCYGNRIDVLKQD